MIEAAGDLGITLSGERRTVLQGQLYANFSGVRGGSLGLHSDLERALPFAALSHSGCYDGRWC